MVFLMAISLIFTINPARAQKNKKETLRVKGSVTAFQNFYLKNVEVSSKKAKTMTTTDSTGGFEIETRSGDLLIFNANGFEPNRRKVSGEGELIQVNMILLEGKKNQKMAVGYGYIDEEDLTHAVANFNFNNNDFSKYSTMQDLLRQELPGAMVSGGSVYTRGSQNVMNPGTSTNTGAALYVVDGIPVDQIGFLTPQMIASITLLKGPEAAIYGSRGANGVVLITTRQ